MFLLEEDIAVTFYVVGGPGARDSAHAPLKVRITRARKGLIATMYQSRIRNAKAKQERTRALVEPEEGQEYALVQDLCGNGRLRALCSDGKVRMGRIRGSMRRNRGKVIIERGDLVLVAQRDFEEDKVDVFHKFRHDEANKLLRDRELPEAIYKAITQADQLSGRATADDQYIEFVEDAEDGSGGEGARDLSRRGDDGSDDSDSDAKGSNTGDRDLDIDAI